LHKEKRIHAAEERFGVYPAGFRVVMKWPVAVRETSHDEAGRGFSPVRNISTMRRVGRKETRPTYKANPGVWTHRGRAARAEGDSRGSIQARNDPLPTVNSFSGPAAKTLKFL